MCLSRFLWFVVLIIVWSSCCFLLILADGPVTDPEEVAALRAIQKSLVDPYQNLGNWKHGDPCIANWDGVLCLNMSTDDGYLHIGGLQLLNMNLSGSLSPALGHLSFMKILDFTWNEISGIIPKEIGSITALELLLLNGNKLTGYLPEEIGYLPNLVRLQVDQNQISGPIPKSFANLTKTSHLHMNNNSISGQIPRELSTLPSLIHLLLDNNNLSGYLPPDLVKLPNLLILQLDNNRFAGGVIPSSYGSMPRLLKLSLRNCSLQGPIPNLSRISNLAYVDLSSNQLNGFIPTDKLPDSITTIDLSNNKLSGTVPANFSGLPRLQNLILANNRLNGSVTSLIWQNTTLNGTERLLVDLQNNMLSDISGSDIVPPNITVRLQGNPICSGGNLVQFCGSVNLEVGNVQSSTDSTVICPVQACPPPFEYAPGSPVPCFCAAPLLIGYQLKSPLISYFPPYIYAFEDYLTTALNLKIYQLDIDSYIWEEHRLWMNLKIFPAYTDNLSYVFNKSEVLRIQSAFTEWKINDSDVFGPNELLNFTLLSPYKDVLLPSSNSGISKGVLAGTIIGTVVVAVILSITLSLLVFRLRSGKYRAASKRHPLSKVSIIIDGVKSFTYNEMALATNNFDASTQIGQGGYGKVYKGTLADGTVVAIKRAEEGSLQGEREFLTEIELMSRLHHRNLVALIGYCDEEDEQMLIYEFMPNGTLRDHLFDKSKEHLSFSMRLRIAISSAKGILYLHTEADPPIFHRDIKASNILLDSRMMAKVADFGLSRLAPVPDTQGTVPDHVSTVVRGTPGYLDPEYFLTHKLTDKSDVYSLGVVFLELLTGKPPISHGKNIVREVGMAYRSGMIFSSLDGRMGTYPSDCVEKFVSLGLKCCKEETDARPSMAEVVRELESIWRMMPESDTRSSDSFVTEPQKKMKASSSSCIPTNAYKSIEADASYGELYSGVISSIAPR